MNFPLIQKIFNDIKHYAPNALVFMITNQVDLMTEIAHPEVTDHFVIGLGGYIDSMRYRLVLADLLFKNGLLSNCEPRRITAHTGLELASAESERGIMGFTMVHS